VKFNDQDGSFLGVISGVGLLLWQVVKNGSTTPRKKKNRFF